ncbi:recombinase family protein [Methylobacterium sp. WL2]
MTSSLGGIAAALNARGIPAARGGAWTATQVRRVLAPAADAGVTGVLAS